MLRKEIAAVSAKIAEKKARTVAVQLPEGLKTQAWEIARAIEKKSGAEVILFADPCFGACDVAEERAIALGAKLLVHFGHSRMLKTKRTIYVPIAKEVRKETLAKAALGVKKILSESGLKCVALCATVQYAGALEGLAEKLKKAGVRAFIGKGSGVAGQVLGCDFSAVKAVEKKAGAIVFLGDGMFHPLGISHATAKPVIVVEPASGNAELFQEEERERFLRKRHAAVELARNAKRFAVVVSTKPGQRNMKTAKGAMKLLAGMGKEAFIFACDYVRPEYFEGVGVECIVNAACPRIVEDQGSFRQILISVAELEVLAGKRKFGDYSFG